MKISIIGAGNIGGTLGKKWAHAGHEVFFGVRNPQSDKAQKLRSVFPLAQLIPGAEAVSAGDLILISLPYAAVADWAQTHATQLANKIIIDATNNFGGPIVNNISILKNAASTAHVYRAFNSLGWEHFETPQLQNLQIDHFYCGPDTAHRPTIEKLIAEIGVRPIWLGDHDMLPVADALGLLWVGLAFQRGYGRQIALKLLS